MVQLLLPSRSVSVLNGCHHAVVECLPLRLTDCLLPRTSENSISSTHFVNKGEKRSYFRRISSGCPYQYHTNTAPRPTALTAAHTPPNRTSVIKKMAPIIARARKANPPMLRRLAALSLSSLACWRHRRRWWEEGAMSSAAETPVHSSVAKYTYRCCGVTEENP